MVQVYQEPICRRHHAHLISSAVIIRVFVLLVSIVVAFLLAYGTGGFWKKINHEVVQPTVHYSGDVLMILESLTPGQEQVWTTSPGLQALLPSNSLSARVQVGEEDYNQDGKADMIRFIIGVQSPIPVHSVKLLLQFSYSLQAATRLRMYGLAYITASSPLPGSKFSADGYLQLHQAAPLPASIISVAPEKPFLDSSAAVGGTAAQADALLQLDSLFARYQERNVTTVFDNKYPVWKGGNGQDFTVDAKIRIPPNQVFLYRPGPSEMLKWGWVQFICAFLFVWWLMSWLERLMFNLRILETRVISDVQPRQHKY